MTTPTRGSAEERSGGEAASPGELALAREALAQIGVHPDQPLVVFAAWILRAADALRSPSPAWTSKAPEVPGYYWTTQMLGGLGHRSRPRIVGLRSKDGALLDTETSLPVAEWHQWHTKSLWLGPIPVPVAP